MPVLADISLKVPMIVPICWKNCWKNQNAYNEDIEHNRLWYNIPPWFYNDCPNEKLLDGRRKMPSSRDPALKSVLRAHE
jgi:hypothetical protein